MNLHEAKSLAIELMGQHGLLNQGWVFRFDRAVRRFGVCKYGYRVISLSAPLVEANDLENVKDTILHEIAHAIAGPRAGHGYEWVKVCLQIGAKPNRCFTSEEVNVPKLKYYAKCGGCGRVFQKARMKKREVKRACPCQSYKSWDDKILLEFRERF
jgi:predicted SprT family Zn-dependent metalloprotease